MEKIEKFISENWNTLKFITLIIGLLGIFFTFDNYINNQIENKINDNNYIESLTKSLRPFCVFNESGIIVYDHGAAEFIKEISFNKKEETISIEVNQFFQHTPLLITIGANQYSYKANKKDNKTFIYKLSAPSHLLLESSKEVADNKYVLEILK